VKIRFSMPVTSIIPVAISVLMLWVTVEVFDALRFLQCTEWHPLLPPPGWVVHLSGTGRDRVYAKTLDGTTYCYTDHWTTACTISPYASTPASARKWVRSQIQDEEPTELIRGGSPTEVTYYKLAKDGIVSSCSTDFKSEVNGMIDSGAIILPLIPIGIIIWCGVIFMKMFIGHGEPTLWDWSGRGTKIK